MFTGIITDLGRVRERTPAAVRIDLAPLEPDPAKLQMPSIVAPFRTTRDPLTVYYDYR